MVFQRKKIAAALACVLGGAVSLPNAFAQAVNPDVPSLTRQPAPDIRVDVTGSSIRRVENEGALPVQIYTREEITRTGATSVAELIQSLPVFQNFTTQADSVGGGGAGFAGAGLRNQGEFRTLVLLNGKRLAPSGAQALTGGLAAVNINNIPLVAIERIEVLTDGASATYGSDAIGGVVNFITRRDVDFGEIQVGGSLPDGSDGKEVNFSAVKGFGTLEKEGFNILIAASRDERDPLRSIDRSYAKTGLFDFTHNGRQFQFQFGSPSPIPANLTVGSVLFSPTFTRDGGCAPQTFFLDGICQYDFTSQLEIYPEQKRDNVFASFTKKLGNHQLSFDYIYSKTETTSRLAPPPGTFIIDSTSPLWPTVLGFLAADDIPVPASNRVTARYRVADVGKRTTNDTSEANHFTAELKGVIAEWDYAASYTRSSSEYTENLRGGWVSNNAFRAALASGLVNPFVGPGQQTPEAQSLLSQAVINGKFDGGKTTIDYIDVHAARPVWRLPAGELQLALGASWLKEKFDKTPSDLAKGIGADGTPDTRFGDTSAIIPYSAQRKSYGVFAEALIPVTKEFEVTPSVRYDDYDDFGSTTNYKVSFRYQPTRQLLFRGSVGSGFKAPTVPQVNATSQSFGVTGNEYSCNDDPRLQAVADSLGVICPAGGNGVQFDQLAGGNRLLKPEESKQWTLGGRWEPTRNFGVGLDFWEVKIENTIGQLDEALVFGNPSANLQSFAPFTDPSTGERLLAFNATNVNLGKSYTTGVDIDIEYRQPISAGSFSSRLFATYIIRNRYQQIPGGEYFNDVGRFINSTTTFPFKAKWINTFQIGDWEHTLAVNYLTGYDDDRNNEVLDVATGEFVQVDRRVGSYTTTDWQTRWTFAKNWTATFGVLNLFQKHPPLSITSDGGGQMIGYNASFSDPRDRTFYANVKFRF
jgi:iron complex outermembrane receptor protein